MTTPSQSLLIQPKFDARLFTMAFPLTGSQSGTIQRGYMIWDSSMASTLGYSGLPTVHYLYNPSTVAADYNIASGTAQMALDYPNPGDQSNLAIPLNQTAQWSLMFDRTFELWGQYGAGGTPNNVFSGGSNTNDPTSIGVQADVMQFMQFTGMFTGDQLSGNGQGGLVTTQNFGASTGLMQQINCWAYFGASNITNNLKYYGYINEWSVQYTHWTQYDIPMRCVISVNFTMLPWPTTQPSQNASDAAWSVLPTPTGGPGITNVANPGQTTQLPTTGVGGR